MGAGPQNTFWIIALMLFLVVLLQTFGRGGWRLCPFCGKMQEHAKDCPRKKDPGTWS